MSAESIRELFSAQVERTPEATAVTVGTTRLTYRELDERSDRLARYLIGLGTTPDAPVAVLVQRSIQLVVAILAVVKTGAPYLPLHDAHPADHTQWIVNDAGASVLLTDAVTRTGHVPDVAVTVSVDALDGDQAVPPARVAPPPGPDHVACVIYTSGSTGRPKGVAVTSRGIVSVAEDSSWDTGWHRRTLMVAPAAFSVLTYELWVPLLRGGEIVLAPHDEVDIPTLRTLIADHQITGLHLTAGLFRVVADEEPTCLAGLHEVLVGGDVVSPAAVSQVRKMCPDTAVRVTYGATETTLFTMSFPVDAHPDTAPLPIGFPMDDTRIYVLDEALRPVSEGGTGELYVSGPRLAAGYVGRPDLTVERFVEDPFAGSGERMYRTGDLARVRQDGAIVLVGRADDQVKIRGFRVELPAVEAAAAGHPGVDQVVVLATDVDLDAKRLVAYVVSRSGGADVESVRAHVARVLPDYMVPSAVVRLEALPLTANGKLDRKALHALGTASDTTRVAPRNEVEAALCRIFSDVLGHSDVGVNEDFFELGGDSLSAMRLLGRVRTMLRMEISVDVLYDISTVSGLAVWLSQRTQAAA